MENNKIMKTAVLIDAENISNKYAKLILDEASNFGTVICRRIYGDWSSNVLTSWRNSIMDYSITAIQQFQNTAGKNSSDSALIIDAMDLLHDEKYQCICIVSSDSDFTRLAMRLRESEIYVVGMGEQKTPIAFRNACDKFLYLDILYNQQKEEEMKQQKPAGGSVAALGARSVKKDASGLNKKYVIRIIHEIIDTESNDDGWCLLADLGNKLMKRLPDFDVRNFGYNKLGRFIQSIPTCETRSERLPSNPTVKVVYIRNNS